MLDLNVGTTRMSILLRPALSDRLQQVSDDFGARLSAEIAFPGRLGSSVSVWPPTT
jgi:hypothetical protein